MGRVSIPENVLRRLYAESMGRCMNPACQTELFIYDPNNFRELSVAGRDVTFVYKYCLSKEDLYELAPSDGCVIVNLHNWNGQSCISKEAYAFSEKLGVTLLTMEDYYVYFRNARNS